MSWEMVFQMYSVLREKYRKIFVKKNVFAKQACQLQFSSFCSILQSTNYYLNSFIDSCFLAPFGNFISIFVD